MDFFFFFHSLRCLHQELKPHQSGSSLADCLFVFCRFSRSGVLSGQRLAVESCLAVRTDESVVPYARTYTQNPLRGKSPLYANSWRGDVETPVRQMNSKRRCSQEHLEVCVPINHSNTYSSIRLEFPCL